MIVVEDYLHSVGDGLLKQRALHVEREEPFRSWCSFCVAPPAGGTGRIERVTIFASLDSMWARSV